MILLVLVTLFSAQLLIFFIFVLETDENNVVTNKIDGDYYLLKTASVVKMMENGGNKKNLGSLNTYRVNFSTSDNAIFLPSTLKKNDQQRSIKLKEVIGDNNPESYIRQFQPIENRFYSAIMYLVNQLLGKTQEDLKKDPRNIIFQSQVKLTTGKWIYMTVYDLNAFPIWISSTIAPTFVFTIIFIIFAVLVVKRITSPLAELADRASELGKGHSIKPILPRGPKDVQNAISAFNTMHKRLLSVNDHRARALAAISHDIRTPLTSMRLNAEYIKDKEIQQKFLDKIADMEQICEATVTFALKDSWSEKDKYFDLVSLIESLCCDLNEQNLNVEFLAEGTLAFQGRPIALKRALNNLIRNGVEYGERVKVNVYPVKQTIEIHIQDQGNGIPESEKERLFEPFERIEQSRNRESGGLGLGMAIALSVIRSHGGEIELRNILAKGLNVVVILPL